MKPAPLLPSQLLRRDGPVPCTLHTTRARRGSNSDSGDRCDTELACGMAHTADQARRRFSRRQRGPPLCYTSTQCLLCTGCAVVSETAPVHNVVLRTCFLEEGSEKRDYLYGLAEAHVVRQNGPLGSFGVTNSPPHELDLAEPPNEHRRYSSAGHISQVLHQKSWSRLNFCFENGCILH